MKNYLILFTGLLLLASCASVNTFSDSDNTVNFSAYKTFAWLPNPDDSFANNLFSNQIIETNIKNYVNKELADRNYRIDRDSPDLIFEYNVDIERKVRTIESPVYQYPYNYNWAYNPYFDNYYRYRYGAAPIPYTVAYRTEQIPYTEGSITISAIDRRMNRLVWRGWSIGTINDPVSYRQNLERDIHNIFKKYPVKLPDND